MRVSGLTLGFPPVWGTVLLLLCLVLPPAEPHFISMAQMPESQDSSEGDDDKVYLFFNEAALEYDSYSKLVVSRVARVCKVCSPG